MYIVLRFPTSSLYRRMAEVKGLENACFVGHKLYIYVNLQYEADPNSNIDRHDKQIYENNVPVFRFFSMQVTSGVAVVHRTQVWRTATCVCRSTSSFS